MALETPLLMKSIAPLITAIVKESAIFLKKKKIEWDSDKSVEKLSNIILDINTVRTMWSRDKSISIDEFYYPPKIIPLDSLNTDTDKKAPHVSLEHLTSHNTILEGIVGQGKSIIFRQLCNVTIEQSKIPIFIELRYISEDRDLIDLILDFMDAAGINGGKPVFEFLASNKKINLILDGFDEIQTDLVKKCIYEIERLRKKFENLKIIISSRPHHAVQKLPGFSLYRLTELTSNDYEPFIIKLISDPITRTNITYALEHASPSIKGVITTPLMLTLLCVVYAQEGDIPSSLPSFYERLFNAVFIKHDNFKAGFNRQHFSKLSESKLQKLFDAFCFMAILNDHGRTLTRMQFEEAFERAEGYVPTASCEIEGFKKDIVNVACLMLEDGYDQTSFLHKSIAEYHAASFIKGSSEIFATQFYEQANTNYSKWAEPLNFLSFIDEFRFANLYIQKFFPAALKELSATLDNGSTESLNNYINNNLGPLEINIEEMNVTSFSLPGRRENYLSDRILNAIVALSTSVITPDAHIEIRSAIKKSKHHTDDPEAIDMHGFTSTFDMEHIWTSLKVLEQELIEKLEHSKIIIEVENQKGDIFKYP